jgi:hypothetical protein
MKRFIALSFLVVSGCYSNLAAQEHPPVQSSLKLEKTDEEKFDERVRSSREELARATTNALPEPRVITSGLLAPSQQDRAKHRKLLGQSDTGLIRLLPREVYDWRTYKTPQQLELRGGGAYYSFFYLSHEYGYGSDVELDHNLLSTGFAGADVGMLTDLGNVPLNDIRIDDSRVSFMATYSPPTNEPGARVEQERVRKGFEVSGMEYRRSLPLNVGSTYLLRSVVYRRSDVLVAFTVLRKNEDGSAILAWKSLKTYDVPELN